MKEIRIFEGVSEGDIKFILSKCDIEIFTKYDKIMTQGEDSNGKGYIIKSGFVSIERNGTHIAELGEGEVFGEIALLTEDERTATVKALTDVETYVITQDSLLEIVNNYSNTLNKEVMKRIEMNMILED